VITVSIGIFDVCFPPSLPQMTKIIEHQMDIGSLPGMMDGD